MKRINSLLMAFLLLGLALPASADLVDGLEKHSVESISTSSATEISPGKWYAIYNPREYTTVGGGYFWDRGYSLGDGTGVLYMSEGTGVIYEDMLASSAAPFIVRFIEPDTKTSNAPEGHAEYYLQFGTGNYVKTPTTPSNSATLQTVATLAEASTLYAYLIGGSGSDWGFETTEGSQYRIDNNGSGATVVTWATGDETEAGGNDDWKLYEVTISTDELTDLELAKMEMMDAYEQYVVYYEAFDTDTTAGFNYYDADAVKAFQDALDAIAGTDTPDYSGGELTADLCNQLTETLIAAYEAVLASYVSRAAEVEDGYYFFNVGGLVFSQSETTDPTIDDYGEEVPGETITTYYTKGMYSEASTDGNTYALWNTHEDTAPYLWKVTGKGDKTYQVVNVATGTTFDTVTTSGNETMSSTEENENLVVFDQVKVTDEDTGVSNTYLAIRLSTQPSDDYYYLHCGGHNSGAGVSGNIVGWSIDAGASQWTLVPVSDEDAENIITAWGNSSEKHYLDATQMIAEVEPLMKIAFDSESLIVGDGLITDSLQFYSPYTELREGGLGYLIDGDAETYWHSDWTEVVDAGTHYLEVNLANIDELPTELCLVFTRRPVTNDHITEWDVYGVPTKETSYRTGNTDNIEKSSCTFLAELDSNYGSNTETITSDPFSITATDDSGQSTTFTTLRFYIADTYVLPTYNDGVTRGYGHVSEFQLYEVDESVTTQKIVMGEIYTNLETAIATVKSEGSELSEESYNAFVTAYEAFMAKFVDPTELRQTLAQAATATEGMVTGTNPGTWSDTSTATTLETTVEGATKYNASGDYLQETSDNYVKTLLEEMEAITAAAIQVQTGKWYKFRFATEDEYDEYGWSTKSSAEAADEYTALFGKYVSVAELIEPDDEDEDGVDSYDPMDAEDVCVGQNLYFINISEMTNSYNEDCAKFRFINVGDTAYMIQNKATSLFIRAAGQSGAVTLSAHPTLFKVSAMGYGKNLLAAETLTGDFEAYLHAQLAYNVLVTWDNTSVESNTGLFIEDIDEAVASDYDDTTINIGAAYGSISLLCFPVALSTSADDAVLYGVQNVDVSTIELAPIEDNAVEAGKPFVLMYGDPGEYSETEPETEPVAFTMDYSTLAPEPSTVGKHVGRYYDTDVEVGYTIASGNGFVVSKQTADNYVGSNSGYIKTDLEAGDTVTYRILETTYDSIEETVAATLVADGDIYTLDGKFLGKGNLTTVKAFGRGLYIVNGVKVLVK